MGERYKIRGCRPSLYPSDIIRSEQNEFCCEKVQKTNMTRTKGLVSGTRSRRVEGVGLFLVTGEVSQGKGS